MDASPELASGSGAAGAFVNRLRCLTNDELAAVVRRVGAPEPLRPTTSTGAGPRSSCRSSFAGYIARVRQRSRPCRRARRCSTPPGRPRFPTIPSSTRRAPLATSPDRWWRAVPRPRSRSSAEVGRTSSGNSRRRPNRPLPDAPAPTGAYGGHGAVSSASRGGVAPMQRPSASIRSAYRAMSTSFLATFTCSVAMLPAEPELASRL